MFQRSLDLVEEAGLTYLHVFPYSARRGTPAARMPQVPAALRKERAARLRAAGAGAVRGFLAACVGRTVEALMERGAEGRSEQFAPVRLPTGYAAGTLVRARVTGAGNETLIARPL
jgi:threonylcarbamoyladenosine tRNA methylthiotransferase MtaB